MNCCRLCAIELQSQLDFNLVNGLGQFRPIEAIIQLPFTIANTSPYVCRSCKNKLKSYVQSKAKTRKIENEIKNACERSGTNKAENTENENSNSLMKCVETESKEIQTNLSFSNDIKGSNQTVAYVHVCWPTGDRSRLVPADLTKMAIYLLRSQNKNMAKFAFKHPLMKSEIMELVGKQVNKECQGICREFIKVEAVSGSGGCIDNETEPKSRRYLFQSSQKRKADNQNLTGSGGAKKFVKKDVRSILKKTSENDLTDFKFENANKELQERCPLFWRILKAASTNHNKTEDVHLPVSIVTAASVCIKNRSNRMTAVQLIISLIINHSSYTVSRKTKLTKTKQNFCTLHLCK